MSYKDSLETSVNDKSLFIGDPPNHRTVISTGFFLFRIF